MDSKVGMPVVFKIAITGPESTGKSTLAKSLADHYNTRYVEEYARQYLEELTHPYDEPDLLNIATGQAKNEQEMLKKARGLLFCDTDMIVIKIWSLHKYNRVAPEISRLFSSMTYHHYLLMNIDLPWVFDPLREHPDQRSYFFNWFIRELEAKNASYSIISGSLNERLENAISIINGLFPNFKPRSGI